MTIAHTSNFANAPSDGDTVTWAVIPNATQGDGVAGDWLAASFQVGGTFGAAGSVQMEGSNDGVNFVKLSPAAVTVAGLFSPLATNERPKYIRPNVTAGDGTTALTVTGFLKKHRLGNF